jgi:gas vesicle protein
LVASVRYENKSVDEENAMKCALSFLLGAVTGAAVAMLFAPYTGEELRSNIKTQAETEYARLQVEYRKGMQEIQTRLDKMSSELQAMVSSSK